MQLWGIVERTWRGYTTGALPPPGKTQNYFNVGQVVSHRGAAKIRGEIRMGVLHRNCNGLRAFIT